MAIEGPLSAVLGHSHSEIEIKDLEVPAENLLGGEGEGFSMGQHRLAYGRLRHGMHNVSMAQRALDMATEHVVNRTTFGKKLDERQAVQFMLAECASQIYIARLMLLHIAYKAEHKMDIRQENGIAKVYLANMVHKVVDTAIQLHGALGYSLAWAQCATRLEARLAPALERVTFEVTGVVDSAFSTDSRVVSATEDVAVPVVGSSGSPTT